MSWSASDKTHEIRSGFFIGVPWETAALPAL
jgi:hypothetical protein